MNTKKIKIKYVLFCILIMLVFITISIIHNQNVMSQWIPSEDIIGIWSGKSEVNISSKINSSKKDEIDITITVQKDGTIIGTIGDAELIGCHIALNRTDFERLINVKTDFIITGGYLKGKCNSKDLLDYRDISMPFNITNGTLKGSIFHVEGWKYPYPLFTHIKLKHQ